MLDRSASADDNALCVSEKPRLMRGLISSLPRVAPIGTQVINECLVEIRQTKLLNELPRQLLL